MRSHGALLAAAAAAAALLAIAVRRRRRAVALNEHRRGQTQCEEEVTVEEAQRRFARLADGELSPPVALRGLRAVHRQRLSKGLHFVCLRCPSGRTIEAVLRTELLADQQLGQLYRLGDALTVSGALEARRGRLSIRATRLSVDEPWTSLFGDIPFVHDFAAAAAAGGAGDVLLQTAISHAERVRERLDANAGVRCVAGLVRPRRGRVRRDDSRSAELTSPSSPASRCGPLRMGRGTWSAASSSSWAPNKRCFTRVLCSTSSRERTPVAARTIPSPLHPLPCVEPPAMCAYREIRGDTARYGEIRGDARRYGEYREIRGDLAGHVCLNAGEPMPVLEEAVRADAVRSSRDF